MGLWETTFRGLSMLCAGSKSEHVDWAARYFDSSGIGGGTVCAAACVQMLTFPLG